VSKKITRVVTRIVIDTNVFISGLISNSQSPPVLILNAVRDKKLVHLISDPIIEEYLRVLDYPKIRKFKKVTDEFIRDISAYLIHWTERIELISKVKLSSDPGDNIFLETAVDGSADFLVTGDKANTRSFC
jgi:uncharacterized protein